MKKFIRNHMFAIPLVSVLAIGASGSAIVWNATTHQQVAVQAPPAEASTVEWGATPAADVIRASIAAVPQSWTRRGEQLTSVTPPFPLSCNVGGIQSAYSVSQQYNNGTTVELSSYTAGTGALAMQYQKDHARDCVDKNTGITVTSFGEAGTEAFTIQARRGVATSQTTVFRRGDIIGYVLVDGGNSTDATKTVDHLVADAMGDQCVNQNSGIDDASRTIWSGLSFTGLLKDTSVSIGNWSLPSVPAGSSYTATPVPDTATPQVQAVTMPKVPDYPVWPLLPAEKPQPKLPVAPADKAVTDKTIKTRVKDEQGPGCGWVFTGTVAPVFDENGINTANEAAVNSAKEELTKGAEDWSKSVLTYWQGLATYKKDVEAYEKFRADVMSVDAAWEPIRKEWKAYDTDFANYQNAVHDRDDFVARKDAAQKSYDAAVAVCAAPDPSPSPSPSATPTPTATPSPSSSPSITPSAPAPTASPSVTPQALGTLDMDRAVMAVPMVKEGCPAVKPAILSEDAPAVPTAPEKPKNPVPEDKR